jgi:hypothetical protein
MGCFIIDADTCRAWKSVGDPGCRASPVAPEYLSTHGVEFPGCRARSDGLHHGLAGLGDNTTSTKECIEIFLRIDRHSRILRLDRDAPPGALGRSMSSVLQMSTQRVGTTTPLNDTKPAGTQMARPRTSCLTGTRLHTMRRHRTLQMTHLSRGRANCRQRMGTTFVGPTNEPQTMACEIR